MKALAKFAGDKSRATFGLELYFSASASLASSAAMRALSSSFSARAFSAIAFTASNSSRCTTSISFSRRSRLRAHHAGDLALDAVGRAGGVRHQACKIVEEAVGRLRHGLGLRGARVAWRLARLATMGNAGAPFKSQRLVMTVTLLP